VIGLAQHQGIYIPFLLDKAQCNPNPLALGYVRGHYLSLVGEEKEPTGGVTTVFLPVTSHDGHLLPVQFLRDVEEQHAEEIIRQWFSCRVVNGILCVEQRCGARSELPEECQTLIKRFRTLPALSNRNLNFWSKVPLPGTRRT